MTWDNINVYQYQQIIDVLNEPVEVSELIQLSKLICIVFNMTDAEVMALELAEFTDKCNEISFLHKETMQPKTVKYVNANGRKYRFVPDITKMRIGGTARYIEAKEFSKDFNTNIHKIAASMVVPQRKTWYGRWVDIEYDANKHADYADDMLHVSITEVYGMVVFFCKVFKTLIDSIRASFMSQLMQVMTETEASDLLTHLCKTLDGYIQPLVLQRCTE